MTVPWRSGATWRHGELRPACDSDARSPRTRNWHLARTRDRGVRVRARVTCRFDGRVAAGPLNGGRARWSSRAWTQGPFSVRARNVRPGDRVRRLHCPPSERQAVPVVAPRAWDRDGWAAADLFWLSKAEAAYVPLLVRRSVSLSRRVRHGRGVRSPTALLYAYKGSRRQVPVNSASGNLLIQWALSQRRNTPCAASARSAATRKPTAKDHNTPTAKPHNTAPHASVLQTTRPKRR